MLPEIADGVEALQRTQRAFLAQVRASSPAQQRFRPLPNAWSMLDVAEHLVLAEERSLLGVLKGPRPGTRVTAVAHLRMLVVRFVMATSLRVKVPVPTVVPEGSTTLDNLEARWEAAHQGIAAAFEPITRADTGAPRFRHPLTGWVTAREGLAFMAGHIQHHARQLARIRGAAGFPGL